MASPPVQPDEPGVLPVPLADEDLPAWWGPILDSSATDRDQLGGIDLDLDDIAEVTGSDPDVIREFASTHQPARRYLVAEPLSATVWAAVYIAIDMDSKRPVVLKISRRVVEREGSLIALINHPNVVTAHHVFVHAGYPTTALERCQCTLNTYTTLADWRDTLDRALEAGRGLAHLHRVHKLVHGDVKPTNILIHEGTGKVADLGLAGPEQVNGAHCGTPSYSPPERQRGVFVFAGDVYSFALTIVHVLRDHDGVPKSLARVLEGALAADYERRPSLLRLLGDLKRELEAERARPEIERRLAAHRRHRSWLQTAVVVAALVSSGGTIAIAGMCRPASNLELAERAAEQGDGVAAVQNLELAMRQALLETDDDAQKRALGEVATVAESLGHEFHAKGDRLAAERSWYVAAECYFQLDDAEGEARVTAAAAKASQASH